GLAVDKFGQALANAGAKQGAQSVKINLAPDSDEDIKHLDDFAKALVKAVNA
ncbi:MAG: flavodoxin, partial [Ligilactobacillus murinus]|nr:flavodoxin [Ligilactobacillus murinus]